ncbi:tRNA-splicing endonuclease subunit [Thoreauomyces humboldtii]|nr:tRNA-splicing endonuclease subunit [Thoreauomyces humboldtii]
MDLRTHHHILGATIGTLPRLPLQNTFFSLPILLLDEEVSLLLSRGLAQVVDSPTAHEPPTDDQIAALAETRRKDREASEAARKITAEEVTRRALMGQGGRKDAYKRTKKQKEGSEDSGSMSTTDATAEVAASPPSINIPTVPESESEPPTPVTALAMMMENMALRSAAATAPPSSLPDPIPSPPPTYPTEPTLIRAVVPAAVSIPAASTTLPWFDVAARTHDVEEARRTGLWTYPRNEAEILRLKVFTALWEMGYFITSGSKFGGDFLLYPGDMLRYHAQFVASVVPLDRLHSPLDAVVFGRLGTAVKKSHAVCSWDPVTDSLVSIWHLDIHHCVNSEIFIVIFYLAGAFSVGVVLFGAVTLFYRGFYKGHSLRHIKLASFDAFLLLENLWAFLIAGYYLVLAAGGPDVIVRRKWLIYGWQNFPWTCGRSALWAYIITIAQTTPRSGDVKVYLPKDQTLTLFLRAIVFIELITTTPIAIAAGWAYDTGGDDRTFYVLALFVNLINCVLSASLAGGTWFFGKQMVLIVQESVRNLQGSLKPSGLSSVATQRTSVEVRLSKTVLKMKMTNLAILCSLGWYSGILIVYSFIPDTMIANPWWAVIQCFGGYLAFFVVQLVTLWAEFFPPDEPGDVASLLHSLLPMGAGKADSQDKFLGDYSREDQGGEARVIMGTGEVEED